MGHKPLTYGEHKNYRRSSVMPGAQWTAYIWEIERYTDWIVLLDETAAKAQSLGYRKTASRTSHCLGPLDAQKKHAFSIDPQG